MQPDETTSRNAMDRRTFLRQVETVAVGAVCASRGFVPLMLAACGGARYASASRVGSQLVIPLTELSKEGRALVEVEGELPIYVRRREDGNFTATLTRCMHKGCQVEPSADRFVCPCHGSEYTFDGAVLKGPTENPLIRYRVTSDDARVYIHLDAPLPGASS
jgi:cytochrome b6-f complex iron-sulfur subunit